MKGTILKFGLISGLVMAVGFMISIPLSGTPTNYDTMEIYGYASMLIAMVVVFFGVKSYRDRQSGGRLKFGRGVLAGVGISAVASLILALYTFVHIAWIDPGFGDGYAAWEINKIEASDMSAEEKTQAIREIEELKPSLDSPLIQGLIMFAMVLVFGIITSLIAAAVLKREGEGEATYMPKTA